MKTYERTYVGYNKVVYTGKMKNKHLTEREHELSYIYIERKVFTIIKNNVYKIIYKKK